MLEFCTFAAADTKLDQIGGATPQNGRLIANIEGSTGLGKLPSNANYYTMFHIHKIWNRNLISLKILTFISKQQQYSCGTMPLSMVGRAAGLNILEN